MDYRSNRKDTTLRQPKPIPAPHMASGNTGDLSYICRSSYLSFNPCHKYGYSILLFGYCQLSACGYMVPLAEAAAATTARGMLGYEYGMASHGSLLAVISAGASLRATKSSACWRIVVNPFEATYSLSFAERRKRLRKEDLESLTNKSVRS